MKINISKKYSFREIRKAGYNLKPEYTSRIIKAVQLKKIGRIE